MKNLITILFTSLLCLSANAYASGTDKVAADEAWNKIQHGALLVDVRTPKEFQSGHIEGAVNIPHTEITKKIAELEKNKEREIVLYCRSGKRAGKALEALKQLGYQHVVNAGGYRDLLEHAPKG
ncbi:MAG: rhodanese-like domain-containing protein [Candidatus Dadabacteria bacterium]|nr:MAG: rhodanese-like domain-containing protein [Candidatus Dadabacteria bacterium]